MHSKFTVCLHSRINILKSNTLKLKFFPIIHTIFILYQNVEKALAYNEPSNLYFVNMTNAFEEMKLNDMVDVLGKKSE